MRKLLVGFLFLCFIWLCAAGLTGCPVSPASTTELKPIPIWQPIPSPRIGYDCYLYTKHENRPYYDTWNEGAVCLPEQTK